MTLLFRIYTISFNWEIFHRELQKLKLIFQRNGFPLPLINKCINIFVSKQTMGTEVVCSVPKKEFLIILPFLGVHSLRIRNKLNKCFQQFIPYGNVKVIFRSSCRIGSFFKFKDSIPLQLLSQVIYKFSCSTCNSAYIGKTPRHFVVRECEHLNLSPFTGNPVNRSSQVKSNVENHIHMNTHVNDKESFSIIATDPRSKYDVRLRTQESILIKKHNPELNGQITSIPLILFK